MRDGGCRWPGCEQPPSWSEAHHIENWLAANGLTNIDQAILLCTPHHLLLHNRGWKTLLHHDQYWLQPPADIDPEQTPIALPSKDPLLAQVLTPVPQPPLIESSFPPATGLKDTAGSRQIGRDRLDQRQGNNHAGEPGQRDGGNPAPGRSRDDYRN